MTELNTGAEQAAAEIPVVSLPESSPARFSISQAARALQSARYKKDDTPAEAPAAAAEPEASAQAEDGASQATETPPEMTQSPAGPEAERPPLASPRPST